MMVVQYLEYMGMITSHKESSVVIKEGSSYV